MSILSGLLPLLFFFAAAGAPSIKESGTPVRTGCEASDSVVAQLDAGQAVTIRFAMAGSAQPCLKISATQPDGREVLGYVNASALTSVAQFDEARRGGASLSVGATPPPAPAVPSAPAGELREASELLNQQRPEEALKRIEAALARNPRSPELLAFAGLAAYKADRMTLAKQYFAAAQEIQPSAEVEQWLRRVNHELASDHSGEKLYGTRFVLRYDGTSVETATAHGMAVALEEEYARVSNALSCNGLERITTVVQTPEAYRTTTGAAVWSGAQYDGKIHVALFESGQMGPETRKTFAHEIVHACLHSLGAYPAWLHEGMAQRLSGETLPDTQRQTVTQMASSGQLPKLTQLGQNWSGLTPAQAGAAYAYARVAVDTLFDKYQGIGIVNILRSPALLQQATAGVERSFAP